MSDTDTVTSVEQDGRTLSGVGADAATLEAVMERHAPEPVAPEAVSRGTAAVEGASPPVPAPDADKPTRGQKRFAELTAEREAARAEAAAMKAERETLARELSELKARPAAQTPEPSQPKAPAPSQPVAADDPNDPRPTEADFETYGEFTEKLARWAYRQAKRDEAAEDHAAQTKARETAAQRDFETRVSTWVGRRDAYLAANPLRTATLTAFLDTVLSGTPIGDALMYSEHGPSLADHLADHPDERARIEGLSPASAILALGRIEASFSTPSAPKPAPKPPPAPYSPVNGNGPTSATPSSELASKGYDFDKSGYREKRAAERKAARGR